MYRFLQRSIYILGVCRYENFDINISINIDLRDKQGGNKGGMGKKRRHG